MTPTLKAARYVQRAGMALLLAGAFAFAAGLALSAAADGVPAARAGDLPPPTPPAVASTGDGLGPEDRPATVGREVGPEPDSTPAPGVSADLRLPELADAGPVPAPTLSPPPAAGAATPASVPTSAPPSPSPQPPPAPTAPAAPPPPPLPTPQPSPPAQPTGAAGASAAPTPASPTPAAPTPTRTPLPPAATPTPRPAPPAALSAREQEMLDQHNVERAKAGSSALRADATLVSVARHRAQDMASKGYFSHTSPSGETAFSLMTAYGYGFAMAGENIARNNYPDVQTVQVAMSAFMSSPGHRANLLDASFSSVGIGAAVSADGMKYFVVVFAAK